MEIFDGYYYKSCKWSLQVIGLWPYQSQMRRINSYIIFYAINLSLAIPQAIILVRNWKNLNIMIENTMSLMFAIVCLSKYSVSYTSAKQLDLLFLQIVKDWKTFERETERKILEKNTEQARVLVNIYICYVLFAWITYTSMPFIPNILDKTFPLENGTRSKLIPFFADYIIFDQLDHHYWCCGHIAFVYFLGFFLYTGVDGAYVLTVKHVCGLFEITCNRMTILGMSEQINNHFYDRKSRSTIKQEISNAVKLHNESIRCVGMLEDSFSKCFLIVQALCVVGFALGIVYITCLSDYLRLVRVSAFMIGIIIHMLYLNWVGEQIIESSSKIFYSAYFSNWHINSTKTRKSITFIMNCSLKCSQLTSGKLTTLSMESFGILMKTAMSYSTVFLSRT